MRIEAEPLVRVGPVRFGMSRPEVRAAMDADWREFRKTKFSRNTTDDFGFCHVFYDQNNACIAVEVFRECEVFIRDRKLFPVPISQAKLVIPDLVPDCGSYISAERSIGIFAPDGDPESILFGERDYYA